VVVGVVTSGVRRRVRLVALLRSRPARLVVQLAVTALVGWLFVVPRLADVVTRGELRAVSGFGWPLAAAAAQVVSLGAYAVMTRAVLAGHPRRPPLRRLLAIDLSSIAVTNCVPVGAAAGTGVGVRLLAREGVRPAEAASAKVLQGGVAALALAVLTTGAAVARVAGPGLGASDLTSLRIGGPVLAGVLVLAAGVGLGAGTRRGRRLGRALARGLAARVRGRVRPVAVRTGRSLGAQAKLLTSQPRVLLPALAASIVNWGADAVSLWCCMHAFGRPGDASGLLLSFGLATAVGWLPITPGGLGVVEAVLIPGLIGLGSSAAAAALGVLLWRLVHSWLPVPLGLVARVSISRRVDRRRSARRELRDRRSRVRGHLDGPIVGRSDGSTEGVSARGAAVDPRHDRGLATAGRD